MIHIHWVWFVLYSAAVAVAGFIAAALCSAASAGDRQIEDREDTP